VTLHASCRSCELVRIYCLHGETSSVTIERREVSLVYGSKVETNALVFNWEATGETVHRLAFAPGDRGTVTGIELKNWIPDGHE